jgi:hypothetical protein
LSFHFKKKINLSSQAWKKKWPAQQMKEGLTDAITCEHGNLCINATTFISIPQEVSNDNLRNLKLRLKKS